MENWVFTHFFLRGVVVLVFVDISLVCNYMLGFLL